MAPETIGVVNENNFLEEVGLENPLPVKVLLDVQDRNIIGSVTPVVVSTSVVTSIAPANPFRRRLVLRNITGTQLAYVGFDNQVSATNGIPIAAAVGAELVIYAKGRVWGLSATGAQTIAAYEESYSQSSGEA